MRTTTADRFRNVIVGVHGRQGARDALALARQLACQGARVVPAHVFFIDQTAPLWTPQVEHTVGRERVLADLRAWLGLAPGTEILSISATSVGEGLHDLAVERQADLIVVGACERGRFRRMVIGDDTRSVLRQMPVPVAVAPPGYASHPAPLRRVGVADNGSPESEGAVALARRVASEHGATLSSVRAERRLADGAAALDLLVVGARQYGRVVCCLHSSPPQRLAHMVSVPLLMVPAVPLGGEVEAGGQPIAAPAARASSPADC